MTTRLSSGVRCSEPQIMSLAAIAVNVFVGDGRDVKHRDWLMCSLPERRFGKTEL